MSKNDVNVSGQRTTRLPPALRGPRRWNQRRRSNGAKSGSSRRGEIPAAVLNSRVAATRFTGPAIERPEAWLPAATWTGIVLTRALAAVSHAPSAPSEVGAGFVVLGEAGETTELFGRDALLAELVGEAERVLDATKPRGPGLAVLVGEPAIGKSAWRSPPRCLLSSPKDSRS